MKVASTGLQLAGLLLAMLGVAVVRAGLEWAADAAIEAKRGVARWWALRRERAGILWSRIRRRPVVVNRTLTDSGSATDAASVTVTRHRADRATISDRDWLALLDDRVESLCQQLDRNVAQQLAEQREWYRRLEGQREELRGEMLAATRQGWQLIVSGIVFSAVGTFLQLWT